MSLPILEHGERYGKLTVLEPFKVKGKTLRYRVGCECGNSHEVYRAKQLMGGAVTKCRKCRFAESR